MVRNKFFTERDKAVLDELSFYAKSAGGKPRHQVFDDTKVLCA